MTDIKSSQYVEFRMKASYLSRFMNKKDMYKNKFEIIARMFKISCNNLYFASSNC